MLIVLLGAALPATAFYAECDIRCQAKVVRYSISIRPTMFSCSSLQYDCSTLGTARMIFVHPATTWLMLIRRRSAVAIIS